MFCSIVGHASFQTAGPMGPSMSERSNVFFLARVATREPEVYTA
jgi:hypothetical protein